MFHKLASKLSKFPNFQQARRLNLQEHVAQTILNEHGITTPKFMVARCGKEAEQMAKDLLTKNLVVKAQVLTGGRGLGKFDTGFQGGVHTAIR
jgi:succinyl-CoA synthetase beta subunit